MKRIIPILLAILMIFALAACGEEDSTPQETEPVQEAQTAESSAIDVDLTLLSSTMVYSEVYNMMCTPDDYIGKTVKMQGQFSVYHDENTGNDYFACVIADATACCQQGMEFVLEGDYSYPEDYPELGTEITVVGEFETYYEGEDMYCHLNRAQMS